MDEKILTPDQVAQILQVHPFTVLKFIKQGKLRASRLGRVYRIRESDVTKFLDEQEAAAAGKTRKQTAPPKPKEADRLLEGEETTSKPKKESFAPSVSKKQQLASTPNQSHTDELGHYILDPQGPL